MKNANIILYALSVWLIISRIYWISRKAKNRTYISTIRPRSISIIPPVLMVLAAALILTSICLGLPLFVTGSTLTATIVLGVSMLSATCLDVVASLKFVSAEKIGKRSLIPPIFSIVIGLMTLAFVLYLRCPPADGIELAYPVKGEWKVVTGGSTSLTNYHHGNPVSQNYAVDIIFNDGDSTGEKIYSPVDGIVVEAINNREEGCPEPEGNLIIIETREKFHIWMAHLRRGSIIVLKGDSVVAGQEIAECGATGSAEQSHLHIHAQLDNKPIPMRFGKSRRFLLRNDIIKNDS